MLDKDPTVELEKLKKVSDRLNPWHQKIDEHYKLYTLESWEMPKKEGDWDNVTVNLPRVLANYVIYSLTEAERYLWIPIERQKEPQRDTNTILEEVVLGAMRMADDMLLSNPETTDIQSGMAWDAAVRRAIVLRCYLWKDKKGELVPDIAVWDSLSTNWISGARKLNWVCYENLASEEDIEEQFEGRPSGQADDEGRYKVQNILDSDEEAVIIGKEYVKKEKHGLDYPPVLILPVGVTRIVPTKQYKDTIKYLGQSVYDNNESIYPMLNRLWTYMMTTAGRAAKAPVFIQWDSSQGNNQPPEIDKDTLAKGQVVLLDKAKGQEYKDYMKPPDMKDVQFMMGQGEVLESMGGVPPIAQGQLNQYLPAAAVSILNHSAQATMKPAKKAMELAYEWLAREILSQFKEGDFGKVSFGGTDRHGADFEADISPSMIKDLARFKCELVPDMPEDMMQKIQMAAQAVQYGIYSPMTARDTFKLSKDPEGEQDKINRAYAEQTGLRDFEIAEALAKDGQFDEARFWLNQAMMARQAKMQGAQNPNNIVKPAVVQGAPQSPDANPNLTEEARLGRMGLMRG